MPVHQEPEEAHATYGQQRIPDLVPNPLRRVGPRFDGSNHSEQRPNSAKETDDLQQMQFEVAARAELQLLQKSEDPKEPQQINQVNDAGDLRPPTPFPGSLVQGQRLSVMFPQNGRNGPKENRQDYHPDAKSDDHVIESLFVESGVHFLENYEGIIDVTYPVAAAVFHESHFLWAVDALEKHWSNFLEVARLTVFLLEETVEINRVVLG